MYTVVVVVGLALFLLPACAGNIPGASVCDPYTGDCSFVPSTPQPTPVPTPIGCVDPQDVQYLYPINLPSTNYANTLYFTAEAGVVVSPALAMELMYQTTADGPFYTEIGDTAINVTGDVPSYVPSPPPGYNTIYASQNLPIPNDAAIFVNIVDTRTPPACSPAGIAGLTTWPVDGLRRR